MKTKRNLIAIGVIKTWVCNTKTKAAKIAYVTKYLESFYWKKDRCFTVKEIEGFISEQEEIGEKEFSKKYNI